MRITERTDNQRQDTLRDVLELRGPEGQISVGIEGRKGATPER